MNAFCDATIPFHILNRHKQLVIIAFSICFLSFQGVMSQVTTESPELATSKSFQTLYDQASSLMASGNYKTIVDGLGQQLIEDFPEENAGFSLYASALELASKEAIAQSNWSKAESYSAKAYAVVPNYTFAMTWAEIAWLNGNNQTALTAYLAASQTREGRSEVWPHVNMAKIYSFSGEKSKEISSLENSIDLLNQSNTAKEVTIYIDIQIKLASCYTETQAFDKAKASYEAVLSQEPNHALATQALQALAIPNN